MQWSYPMPCGAVGLASLPAALCQAECLALKDGAKASVAHRQGKNIVLASVSLVEGSFRAAGVGTEMRVGKSRRPRKNRGMIGSRGTH